MDVTHPTEAEARAWAKSHGLKVTNVYPFK